MRPLDAVRDTVGQAAADRVGTFGALRALWPDNAAMAADLAGTGDKKSKAYGAAIRNVQRWAKGERRPDRKSREKLADAARGRVLAAWLTDAEQDGLAVDFEGVVRVSDDERWRAPGTLYVSPDDLAGTEFVEAVGDGRWGMAADSLAAAWGMAWGIGYGVEWVDVDTLAIEAG